MSCVMRTDPKWPESLSLADISEVSLTMLSEDGCQVPVPAALLLAASPLVRSIMADLLPPSYSPHVISIPAVTGDMLYLVAEILSNGKASVNENSREKISHVFKIMRVEADLISSCQSESTVVNHCVEEEAKSEDFDEVSEGCLKSEIFVKIENSEKIVKNEYFEAHDNLKIEREEEVANILSERKRSIFQILQPSNENNPAYEKQVKEFERNVKKKQQGRGKSFKCDKCTYKTLKLTNLKDHMIIHSGERCYSCDQCDYSGRRLDHLANHKKNTHGTGKLRPFKCDKCDYSGASKQLLKLHMIIHSGEKPYTCDQCDYKGVRRSHLISHKAYKHGEKNQNPITSSLYIKNSTGDLKSYQCQVCGYLADYKEEMVVHVQRHNGKRLYKYEKCEFNIGKSPFLKFHKLNHVNGKQLHCAQCKFKTSCPDTFAKHKIHYGEFKCDLCEFITDHPMYLSSHKRREHPVNLQPTLKEDEPFLCIDCGEKYKSKNDLEKHIQKRHIMISL